MCFSLFSFALYNNQSQNALSVVFVYLSVLHLKPKFFTVQFSSLRALIIQEPSWPEYTISVMLFIFHIIFFFVFDFVFIVSTNFEYLCKTYFKVLRAFS